MAGMNGPVFHVRTYVYIERESLWDASVMVLQPQENWTSREIMVSTTPPILCKFIGQWKLATRNLSQQ